MILHYFANMGNEQIGWYCLLQMDNHVTSWQVTAISGDTYEISPSIEKSFTTKLKTVFDDLLHVVFFLRYLRIYFAIVFFCRCHAYVGSLMR